LYVLRRESWKRKPTHQLELKTEQGQSATLSMHASNYQQQQKCLVVDAVSDAATDAQ
jgi:adenine/guanine phosphoribosyltransferase-like PRPP-binding protein